MLLAVKGFHCDPPRAVSGTSFAEGRSTQTSQPSRSRSWIGRGWKQILDRILMLSLIVLAWMLIWRLARLDNTKSAPLTTRPVAKSAKPSPLPLPSGAVAIEGALLFGSPKAPLVVIEYSDIQCPYCGVFARDILPSFEAEYMKTGKAQIAFRNFPLAQIHPFARQAALAIKCADAQGGAWQMHQRLFADQKALDGKSLLASASAVGLVPSAFTSCMSAAATAVALTADVDSGRQLGVTGTPTFFIGRRESDGRVPN